jgi:cytochrome c oxidase cbb3-type subunit 3
MKPTRAAGAALCVLMLAAGSAGAAEDAVKGRAVFRAHCMQCHGEKADGNGPLARRFNPPPANIAATKRSDDYLLQIVTLGGEALGRSAAMPEWGLELSGAEILDVVSYLRQVVEDGKAQRAGATASAASGGRS